MEDHYHAERYVIASAIVDPWNAWRIAREHLTADDFSVPFYQLAFKVMCEADDETGIPDHLGVGKRMLKHEQSAIVTLARDIMECGYNAAMMTRWVQHVLEASITRKMKEMARVAEMGGSVIDKVFDLQEHLGDAKRRLQSVGRKEIEVTEATLRSLAKERLHQRMDEIGKERSAVVQTALDKIDAAMDYAITEGDVVVIGAVPGHGKTLFTLQCLERNAEMGRTCVFYSYEMGHKSVADRVHSMLSADIATERNTTNIHHWEELHETLEQWKASDRIIFRKVAPRPADLVADMERLHRDIGATVFAIDYLGLIQGVGNSRYEQQSNAIEVIQEATARLGVTSFVACQLSRPSDKSKPYIPTMSSFRDSGQIEAAANAIILLRYPHRDPAYERMSEQKMRQDLFPHESGEWEHVSNSELFEVRVPKIRNGVPPHSRIVCKFQSAPLRIVDDRDSLVNETLETF